MTPTTPVATPRSPLSRGAAWAMSGVVVAITIFALLHLATRVPSPPPTPAEATVATFFAAVRQQDYATAYRSLADAQRAVLTADAFRLAATTLDTRDGKVTAFSEIGLTTDTASATITVRERVTRATRGSYQVALTVIPSAGGAWRIASESGL